MNGLGQRLRAGRALTHYDPWEVTMGWIQYNPADYVGKRFGKLTVTAAHGEPSTGQANIVLSVTCDCGRTRLRTLQNISNPRSAGCACGLGTGMLRHGMYKTREYKAWTAAKMRCYNPRNIVYHAYGGRGIKMCDEWVNSFATFYVDMGPRPDGYSIERLDNERDYCPENCIWLPRRLQNKNLRKNYRIEFNGATYNGRELARMLGVSPTTVRDHMLRGNLRDWLARKLAA